MSLLTVDEKDLIELVKTYSKLVSKYHYDHSLKGFFIGKMRVYTSELKARGVSWKKTTFGKNRKNLMKKFNKDELFQK